MKLLKMLVLGLSVALPCGKTSADLQEVENVNEIVLSYIKMFRPNIDSRTAHGFMKRIMIYSAKNDLSPLLVTGIIRAESNFNHNLSASKFGIGEDNGPMQVNSLWLPFFKITKATLNTVEGGIKYGTKILNMNKREAESERCWWSRYNSRTPSKRREYETLVLGYINDIGITVSCENDTAMVLSSWKKWMAFHEKTVMISMKSISHNDRF